MRPLALLLVAALLVPGCVRDGPSARPYFEEVLSASPFERLVVEVDHAPGRKPSDAALTHLTRTLQNVTSKERVELLVQETLPADDGVAWTAEQLVKLERDQRSTRHEAPVAVLHVIYPAGEYAEGGVAGVTISGVVIGPVVVFLDTLRNITTDVGPLPLLPGAVERLERSTLLHEAGHALGLVENGLPQVRDREDKDHERHSRNPDSVMYWRVESLQGLRDMLLAEQGVPDKFDADDLADLRSAGGR